MELYHIHLLGNHDNLYKANKEFNINKNSFNNRLYDRVMNHNFGVSSDKYPEAVEVLNKYFSYIDCDLIGKVADSSMLLPIIEKLGNKEEIKNILKDLKEILFNASMSKRELSIEAYRKDHELDKPSRLHSLYACEEDSVSYWLENIGNHDLDIFRIDVFDKPFVTSDQLLPPEVSSYIESYNLSKRYFNPRNKDLDTIKKEYLVQGKVKILEKVKEYRF